MSLALKGVETGLLLRTLKKSESLFDSVLYLELDCNAVKKYHGKARVVKWSRCREIGRLLEEESNRRVVFRSS